MFDVNWLAVIASTAASMVIGSFWYSMTGFGKPWMKLSGVNLKDMKKEDMPKVYLTVAVAAFVLSWALANLVKLMGADTILAGAQTGFILWFGLVATTTLPHYLFTNKPTNLYLIDVGYHLVEMVAIGAILAVWP